MLCYEVTESVEDGLGLIHEGEPRVARPVGCPFDIRLHPRIIEFLERVDGVWRVGCATIEQVQDLLLLKQPITDNDNRALVRVGTAGGDGGKAYLTANVLEEEEDVRGYVRKRPKSFPSLGVQPFCTDEELARVRDGVAILDVFLRMSPGANFTVRRTGRLEGAPPVLSVRWSGTRLSIDGLSRSPHARAAPVTGALGPAVAEA